MQRVPHALQGATTVSMCLLKAPLSTALKTVLHLHVHLRLGLDFDLHAHVHVHKVTLIQRLQRLTQQLVTSNLYNLVLHLHLLLSSHVLRDATVVRFVAP